MAGKVEGSGVGWDKRRKLKSSQRDGIDHKSKLSPNHF